MQIAKNRYLDAFLKFLLLSAIIHPSLLLISFSTNLNVSLLNYFDIIGLNLFFPGIIEGYLSQILSVIIMIAIYLIIYLHFTKK